MSNQEESLEPTVMQVLDECIAIRHQMMTEEIDYTFGAEEIHKKLLHLSPRAHNADDVYGHYTIHYKGWVWIHICPDGKGFGFWYMLGTEPK